MTHTIGIDVGGTFTDVVVSTSDGRIVIAKAATTPGDQSDGVLEGIAIAARMLETTTSGLLASTTRIVHGTTVATNALLEGKAARAGMLTNPLRDRFGIVARLEFYTPEELQRIVARGAEKLGFSLGPDGAAEIAKRSRGTPRIAGRLLRRVRDFALVEGAETVGRALADAALRRLDVDPIGLDAMDRRYLRRMAEHHGGGPVGVETLAAALAEARDTLEDVIEPYLIQEGLILRTSRGRMLGERGWRHLGLTPPAGTQPMLELDPE